MEEYMSTWIKGKVDVDPAEAAYDPSHVGALGEYFDKLLDGGKVQAAGFLMSRGGRVFAHQTAGRRTAKPDSEPFRPEHLKNIASISKIVTATAVMQLAEAGKLWLEQPVKSVIPEFDTPLHSSIHIRHLLTHTSGLTADGGYFLEPYPIENWEAMRGDDWLKKTVLNGPLQGEVGRQWAYSSKCFGVLAEIVSRVSGMHFNDYVEQNVLGRIGMERSFLEVPQKLWPEVLMSADWDQLALEHAGDRKGMPGGGGGCYSTLYDLFRLGQCYLNGGGLEGKRLLSKKAVAEMTRNQLEDIPAYHWGKRFKSFRQGLGWCFFADGSFVGPRTYNHEGWGWCSLYVDPDEEFVFVSMAATPTDWSADVMVNPRSIAFSGLL
jgi:CubicO group peptidase (beta-lactamase class C family)